MSSYDQKMNNELERLIPTQEKKLEEAYQKFIDKNSRNFVENVEGSVLQFYCKLNALKALEKISKSFDSKAASAAKKVSSDLKNIPFLLSEETNNIFSEFREFVPNDSPAFDWDMLIETSELFLMKFFERLEKSHSEFREINEEFSREMDLILARKWNQMNQPGYDFFKLGNLDSRDAEFVDLKDNLYAIATGAIENLDSISFWIENKLLEFRKTMAKWYSDYFSTNIFPVIKDALRQIIHSCRTEGGILEHFSEHQQRTILCTAHEFRVQESHFEFRTLISESSIEMGEYDSQELGNEWANNFSFQEQIYAVACLAFVISNAIYEFKRDLKYPPEVHYSGNNREWLKKIVKNYIRWKTPNKNNLGKVYSLLLAALERSLGELVSKEGFQSWFLNSNCKLEQETQELGFYVENPGKTENDYARSAKKFKDKFWKRTPLEFDIFESKPSFHTDIFVSGYLSEKENTKKLWSKFENLENKLCMALKWESTSLGNLLVRSLAAGLITLYNLCRANFIASLFWLGSLVSDQWKLFQSAVKESKKTGKMLARLLMNKFMGKGSISLTGFSLGCQVILSCLEELNVHRKDDLIHNVTFLGGAVDYKSFEHAFRSVSGTIYNFYTSKDFVLRLPLGEEIGRRPINHPKVKNFDLNTLGIGHLGYRKNFGKIFQKIDNLESST